MSTSFPMSSAYLTDALFSELGNRDFLKRKIFEVLTFTQEVMARWSMQQMFTEEADLAARVEKTPGRK